MKAQLPVLMSYICDLLDSNYRLLLFPPEVLRLFPREVLRVPFPNVACLQVQSVIQRTIASSPGGAKNSKLGTEGARSQCVFRL